MKAAALLLLLGGLAFAHVGGPGEMPEGEPATREQALDRLLSERGSPEALDHSIEHARTFGVSDQAVLEARFLFHVDRREDAQLAALLPEFRKRKDKFLLSESEIFAIEEDWLAVVEYVEAIAALEAGDRDGFKKHITEAFWLSPRQGAAFAPHIDRLRLNDAMGKLKVDFTLGLTSMAGKPVALSSLTMDSKALLLHFWSPWSRECEDSMPDFAATAAELGKQRIAVASLLGEAGPEVIADAAEILAKLGGSPAGSWLIDHKDEPLNRLLRVQSVPTMVLVALDGSVLFNGHPSDDRLWQALGRIDPAIKRPATAAEDH